MAGALGDHLWQSTLFAVAMSLLALTLRRNRAQLRYWLWLAASVKFLIPFAALMALGSQLEWRTEIAVAPPVSRAIDVLGRPFSSDLLVEPAADPRPGNVVVAQAATNRPVRGLLLALWLAGVVAVAGVWLIRWRRVTRLVTAAAVITEGREHDILRCAERRSSAGPIRLALSQGALEPGIFGIVRPVLLWPASIGSRLSDAQIEAIVAHELAHVRRRDNLTAAIHMVVQSLFWFHPLVWWLGARLVDERERACDQEVVRLGSEPDVYAEGILKTVQFYLESPLACVSGVTGSDLKQRIEDIMHNRTGIALSSWSKLLLTAGAVVTLAAPLLVGRVEAQSSAAPAATLTFETASVKPNRTGEGRVMMRLLPGGAYEATNVTARAIVQQAMGVAEFQLVGAPDWLDAERYDILAKSPAGASQAEFAQRYRALVEDRFKLKTHQETRELPVYALVLARTDGRLGPQMIASKSDCSPEGMAAMRAQLNAGGPAVAAGAARGGIMPLMMDMPPIGQPRPCTTMRNNGRITGGGSTMAEIARMLQQNTGRIVLDQSGLTGRYDFDLTFAMDPGLRGRGPGGGLPPEPGPQNTRPIDPDALTIFTAVQEQLGLKLDSTRGPVDVVVIDNIERATEN